MDQNPLEVCQTPETNQLVGLRTGFSSAATSFWTLGRKEDSEKATRSSQEIRTLLSVVATSTFKVRCLSKETKFRNDRCLECSFSMF